MKNRKDDIERYLRGELSPAEMHALEKEALNDPFLAEALEGIENAGTNNFLFDLHRLNYAVRERTRKRKERKHIHVWGWTVGIAATVLLVAASGLFVIGILRNQRAEQRAMEESAQLMRMASEPKDTLVIPLYKSSPLIASRGNDHYTSPPTAPRNDPPEPTATQEEIASDEQLQQTEIASTSEPTEESAVASNPSAIPPALAEAEQREVEETLAARSADRAEPQKRSAAGIAGATTINVSIEHDLTNKPSGFVPAIPFDGEATYKTYLRNAVKHPDPDEVKGTVAVSFTVEPDGAVTSFKTLLTGMEPSQEVRQKLEQALIRAIENGPAWRPATSGGQTVADTVKVLLVL